MGFQRRGKHIKPRGKHVKPEVYAPRNQHARCSVDDGPLDIIYDTKSEMFVICEVCGRTYDMKTGQLATLRIFLSDV